MVHKRELINSKLGQLRIAVLWKDHLAIEQDAGYNHMSQWRTEVDHIKTKWIRISSRQLNTVTSYFGVTTQWHQDWTAYYVNPVY